MSKKKNGANTIGDLAAMDTSDLDALGSAQDDDAADETPEIPPALAVEEWQMWRNQRVNPVTLMREVGAAPPAPDNLAKTIALANDQYHNEDPRKFTRATVELLRAAAETIGSTVPNLLMTDDAAKDDRIKRVREHGEVYSQLHELADVIESYLPPEES